MFSETLVNFSFISLTSPQTHPWQSPNWLMLITWDGALSFISKIGFFYQEAGSDCCTDNL